MKLLNIILASFVFVTFFTACQDKPGEKKQETPREHEKELVQDLKNVKVEISGMTCEIGCARLIQSKLYKADGVTFARVSFEDSSGLITFDEHRISKKELQSVIEGAGGGDLYRVASISEVDMMPDNTDEESDK